MQRLINANLTVTVHDADAHVFASEYLLRNIWMAAIQSFENKETAVVVSSLIYPITFSSRVLGLPAGIYVIVSIVQEGFEWSLESILNARNVLAREGDSLQGAWESLIRCRGGLCQHQNSEGAQCVSLFLPWVHSS